MDLELPTYLPVPSAPCYSASLNFHRRFFFLSKTTILSFTRFMPLSEIVLT